MNDARFLLNFMYVIDEKRNSLTRYRRCMYEAKLIYFVRVVLKRIFIHLYYNFVSQNARGYSKVFIFYSSNIFFYFDFAFYIKNECIIVLVYVSMTFGVAWFPLTFSLVMLFGSVNWVIFRYMNFIDGLV